MTETVGVNSTQGRWILIATILASGMAFLDGSIVNVALPTIQRELDLTFGGLQWIVNAYLITLSALILTAGALGDSFGRKRVFSIGIIVFALGSLLCGLSQTGLELILARLFQGAGGALMVPGSLSLIRSSIDAKEQGKAIGLWAGYGGGLAALGPLAGGWLTQQLGWPAIFFINVPLGLLAWFLTQRFIVESRGRAVGTIDWWGTATIVLGLAGLSYGLIQGPTAGWTPLTLIVLTIGIASLVGFFVVEQRASDPLVPFALFRRSTVVGANLATLLIYGALSAVLLFVVLDLQQVRGLSPELAGLAILPMILIITFLTGPFGARADRYGARQPMTVGALLATAGIFWLAVAAGGTSYARHVLPGLLLFGLGMAVLIAPLTKSALSVPESHAGAASGVNNAVARVAGLLAVAILGAVAIGIFGSSLSRNLTIYSIEGEAKTAILAQRAKLAGVDPTVAGVPSPYHPTIRTLVGQSFLSSYRAVLSLAALMTLSGAVASWKLVKDDEP